MRNKAECPRLVPKSTRLVASYSSRGIWLKCMVRRETARDFDVGRRDSPRKNVSVNKEKISLRCFHATLIPRITTPNNLGTATPNPLRAPVYQVLAKVASGLRQHTQNRSEQCFTFRCGLSATKIRIQIACLKICKQKNATQSS